MKVKEEDFVIPGQELATLLEFLPGEGVYVENDMLYAKVYGVVDIDRKERKINIRSKSTEVPSFKRGDMVICEVVEVKDSAVITRIVKAINSFREVPVSTSAIHISNVKEGYVEPGDFVCPGRKHGLRVEKVYLNIPHIENLNDFPDRRYVTYSLRIMCKKTLREKMAGQHPLIADLNPLFEVLPHNYNNPLNLKLTKDLLEANSINHRRRGQNILFCDGSARFVRKRVIGIIQDDIFTLRDTHVYKGDELPSCETDAFLAP